MENGSIMPETDFKQKNYFFLATDGAAIINSFQSVMSSAKWRYHPILSKKTVQKNSGKGKPPPFGQCPNLNVVYRKYSLRTFPKGKIQSLRDPPLPSNFL